MPALDRYDPDVVDDEDYDAMSIGDRMEAERAMAKRDGNEGYRRGFDDFFDESDDGDTPRKKRKRAERAAAGEMEDEDVSIHNM